MLDESDWMDTKTKAAAIVKLRDIIAQIGYPDMALNDTALDEYYSKAKASLPRSFS